MTTSSCTQSSRYSCYRSSIIASSRSICARSGSEEIKALNFDRCSPTLIAIPRIPGGISSEFRRLLILPITQTAQVFFSRAATATPEIIEAAIWNGSELTGSSNLLVSYGVTEAQYPALMRVIPMPMELTSRLAYRARLRNGRLITETKILEARHREGDARVRHLRNGCRFHCDPSAIAFLCASLDHPIRVCHELVQPTLLF